MCGLVSSFTGSKWKIRSESYLTGHYNLTWTTDVDHNYYKAACHVPVMCSIAQKMLSLVVPHNSSRLQKTQVQLF